MKKLILVKDILTSQVQQSILSKQGKTTLTGIFEGRPENVLVNERGFAVPTNDRNISNPALLKPIDAIFPADGTLTYLDTLQNKKV